MKNTMKLFIIMVSNLLLLTACNDNSKISTNASVSVSITGETANHKVKPAPARINWPCLNPPSVTNTIPTDVPLTDQASVNCFAWQEFIGLNWPTGQSRTAADFGRPNDFSPVVFETYKTNVDLFDYKGDAPPKWSDANTQVKVADGAALHSLKRTSKFRVDFDNNEIEEAFPFIPAGQAWLADKHGNLVWYEVLMNQPEYDYFYQNEFYDSEKQYQAAQQGKHIDLPKGDLSGKVGAMELKAAWLTVTNPLDPKWRHYKLAKAQFCSDGNTCSQSTVALVGLHIIHKTASQPSWIWATFEHIDNAPDVNQLKDGHVADSYNFYNSSCKEETIPAACVNGNANQKTSCVKNTYPAYALTLTAGKATGSCQPYPIQVVRDYPIPDTHENPVRATNQAAQNLIKQANSDSVYQYYQLVNVMWNDSSVDENSVFGATNAKSLPLPVNSLSETAFRPNPHAFPVANTTMETYIQGTACIGCHAGATIADPKKLQPQYASDYSFIFSMAKTPNNTGVTK